ncbi:MAG TPA: hypothetical protein VM884_08675 [Flavisolibacter sp.]|jgi:hypothetical protein|nr:hypothetical protein [Flavisolibacter sp.]
MKNNTFLALALLVASAATAQTTKADTTAPAVPPTTTVAAEAVIPEHLKGLTTETLRPEHSFPVLGSYKASGKSTGDITITLDETNKGIVWVEGLSQGKFKALMKKAPATYKVPAQQTESGKAVAEGVLFFNPESKELTIALGRSFDDADPTSFLTSESKGKSKVWQYTGVKADANATVVPPAPQQ